MRTDDGCIAYLRGLATWIVRAQGSDGRAGRHARAGQAYAPGQVHVAPGGQHLAPCPQPVLVCCSLSCLLGHE